MLTSPSIQSICRVWDGKHRAWFCHRMVQDEGLSWREFEVTLQKAETAFARSIRPAVILEWLLLTHGKM